MGHTPPPLRIGVDNNGIGYAVPPDVFEREIGEDVEVEVETACSVRFDPNPFFDDKDYPRREATIWRPKDRQHKGTPRFRVYPYHPQRIETTHSIKIGSGKFTKKTVKPKSKKAKAKPRKKPK